MSDEDSLDAIIIVLKIKQLVKETDLNELMDFYEKVKEIVEE